MSSPARILAVLALLGAVLERAEAGVCSAHSDCAENQYCSDYTAANGNRTVSCYACVDAYRFTCTDYGDSVDQSCAQCAEEEEANGADAYSYINCESHATCSASHYCYKNIFDGFVVQDCWPCQDQDGKSCEFYGDAVDGNCSVACAGSVPTTSGCTTHTECAAGSYCSSYMSAQGTQQIVTCNPCLDSYEYSCEDYGDSVDGKCDVCLGAEDASAGLPTTDDNTCKNPTAETKIAFQLCASHADCRKSEYCSAYKGTAGCVIDCWPCKDMYDLTCADYGDAIDGSCSSCSANASRADTPAAPPECSTHANCAPNMFCSVDELCKPCASCELAASVDRKCTRCLGVNGTEEYAALTGAGSSQSDGWQTFGVVTIVVVAVSIVVSISILAWKRIRAKYGPDDKLALRHNPRAMRERDETEAS